MPARTISVMYAPRLTTTVSTDACHSLICTPSEGKPKNTNMSWTRNGVLRMASTYTLNSALKGRMRQARHTPPAMPMAPPATAPAAVSASVKPTPCASWPL